MAVGNRDDGGRDFRVRAEVLRAYAATVRAQGEALRDIGEAVEAIAVARGSFGKLPQSGQLADGYETHHHSDVAGIADLANVLQYVATALAVTAGRYSAVDGAAAGAFGAVPDGVRDGVRADRRARAPLAEAIR